MSLFDGLRNGVRALIEGKGLRFAIMSLWEADSPTLTDWNYENLVKQGYHVNGILFAAIRKRALYASTVPIKLFKRASDGTEIEVETHPILDLLKSPAIGYPNLRRFIKSYISRYLIDGNVYVYRITQGEGMGTRPLKLQFLRPDRMRCVRDTFGNVIRYEYVLNGKTAKIFEVDPLTGASDIYFDYEDSLLDDMIGISPTKPAGLDIDINAYGRKWNLALLQNGAKPSIVFKHERDPGKEAREEMTADFLKKHGGTDNTGRPLHVWGSFNDIKQVGWSPTDMDFLAGIKRAEEAILNVFEVPPILYHTGEGATFANMETALKSFFDGAVFDDVERILDVVRWLAQGMRADDLIIKADYQAAPALQFIRERREAGANALTFITPNEKRSICGYSTYDDETADRLFISAGQIPIEDTAMAATEDPNAYRQGAE